MLPLRVCEGEGCTQTLLCAPGTEPCRAAAWVCWVGEGPAGLEAIPAG